MQQQRTVHLQGGVVAACVDGVHVAPQQVQQAALVQLKHLHHAARGVHHHGRIVAHCYLPALHAAQSLVETMHSPVPQCSVGVPNPTFLARLKVLG